MIAGAADSRKEISGAVTLTDHPEFVATIVRLRAAAVFVQATICPSQPVDDLSAAAIFPAAFRQWQFALLQQHLFAAGHLRWFVAVQASYLDSVDSCPQQRSLLDAPAVSFSERFLAGWRTASDQPAFHCPIAIAIAIEVDVVVLDRFATGPAVAGFAVMANFAMRGSAAGCSAAFAATNRFVGFSAVASTA
ncbi:MAG TPA: hypothetical protein VFM32_05240, partial [Spongiibacteraceae bacterium]|nr:hypothetical protein [Spongiibacteraceae bacterium]